MGEYVKYKGQFMNLGTCENLYYVTYPKYCAVLQANMLSKQGGNLCPAEYIKPELGFRFRFPFPDEDHLPLGEIKGSFERGVPVKIDDRDFDTSIGQPGVTTSEIHIVQQKLIYRQSDNKLCLAVVLHNPKTRERFRLEDDESINKLLNQIIKFHIRQENNSEQKAFYRTIALRILKGYRLEPPALTLERKRRITPIPSPDDISSRKLKR